MVKNTLIIKDKLGDGFDMRPEEKESKQIYDSLAESYHNQRTKKYPHGWFYNEMTEMPAVLNLLGDVKGKKILDLGCGSGIYAKLLTRQGATVKGFDISPEMIRIAKQENPNLDLKVGTADNIPFNEKFDIVLASLVVHYIQDWNKMFKEIRRILKDRGILIFSTGNPMSESVERVKYKGKTFRTYGNYFRERKLNYLWNTDKGKAKVFAYHITYETIIKRIMTNGFEIIGYSDCPPIKIAKKYFPEDYENYLKRPSFCAWKLRLT